MAAHMSASLRLASRRGFRCYSWLSRFQEVSATIRLSVLNLQTTAGDDCQIRKHNYPSASFLRASSRLLSTASEAVTVKCPPFAESVTEGDVRWELKVGDTVKVDDVLGEIETDKTAIPIVSPVAGTISAILVPSGTTVGPGTALLTIATGEVPGGAPPKAAAPAAKGDSAKPPPTTPVAAAPTAHKPAETPIPKQMPPVTPPSPKPLSQIPVADVKVPPSQPAIVSAAYGTPLRSEERVKMNRMRLRIAQRLKDAQNTCAMLTTFNEVDMSNMMDLRSQYKDAFLKKHNLKLGFMSAFVKAASFALKDQPVVNAVIEGSEIVYRDYVDISVAVATPKGLVVPVLRNVEGMNYAQIERAIEDIGKKARDGNLAVEDMDGGTFTISNGGVFGSLFGTPIINPPQSAILGMHGIFDRPVAIKGQVVIRPMMYIALTYDHRLIDGREAVTFLRKVKSAVEDPRVLLLDL